MGNERMVYCRIFGNGIPEALCTEEQVANACKGCSAASRRCITCGENRSQNPSTGLCNDCLSKAVEQGLCVQCRVRKPFGKRQEHCKECHRELMEDGDYEPGIGARSKPFSLDDMLDKAETLHIDGFVPGLNPPARPVVPPPFPTATAREILEHVARRYEIAPENILNEDRRQEYALPRMIVMYALRERGMSLPKIGEFMHRDHTTALHAHRVIQQKLLTDEGLDKKYVRGLVPGSVAPTSGVPDLRTDPVIVAVSRHFRVHESALLAKDGPAELELPRKVAMYLFAAKEMSFARIAEMFNCTSGEVEAAWKQIKVRLFGDEELRKFTLSVTLGAPTKPAPQGGQRIGDVAAIRTPSRTPPTTTIESREAGQRGGRKQPSGVDTTPYFRVVMDHYAISRDELRGGKKGNAGPQTVLARRTLMWLLRQAGMVAREIADALEFSPGGVAVGLRDIQYQLDEDAQLRETFGRLRERAETTPTTVQELITSVVSARNDRSVVATTSVTQPDPERVIAVVCDHFKVKKESLFKTTVDWRHNDARRVVMLLLQEQGMSSSAVGKLANEKDTNVLLAIQAIKSRIRGDVDLRKAVEHIKSKLEATTATITSTTNIEVTHLNPTKAPEPAASQPDQVDPERYATAVIQEFKIEESTLYSPNNPAATLAQQVFILLMREEKVPFSVITKFLGIPGAAAFMHMQAIERRLMADNSLQDCIDAIKSSLTAAPAAVEEAPKQPINETLSSSVPTEPIEEVIETKKEMSEERKARRDRFMRLPHYNAWLNKVSILDSHRVLRSLTPIVITERVKDPQFLGLLTTITRDEWVETLQDSCAEYLDWNGFEIGFVAHFAEVVPLPQALLEFYVQDERIVQLKSRRTKGDKPSKHLLVFSTRKDAQSAMMSFDPWDFPFWGK